jgi:hypothetical protein
MTVAKMIGNGHALVCFVGLSIFYKKGGNMKWTRLTVILTVLSAKAGLVYYLLHHLPVK